MDIQQLSMNMAQTRIQEEAAVQAQAMAMETAKVQAEDLARLIEPTREIIDPNKGNFIDTFM